MARPRKEIALVKVFLAPRVLTFDQLCKRLSASLSTVVRRLKEHGYYSSYNHSGRFLTIKEAADFDARGLWVWKTACFSRQGNLKDTIQHFVQSSEEGMIHEELAAFLGVRTHNPLRELVEERRIYRERIGPTFVYLSTKTTIRKRQVKRRKSLQQEGQKPRPTSRQIIATLLQLIEDPKAKWDDIVRRCQRSGVAISRRSVEVIFDTYDLDKKRAP